MTTSDEVIASLVCVGFLTIIWTFSTQRRCVNGSSGRDDGPCEPAAKQEADP